jgi:hypothetical protein
MRCCLSTATVLCCAALACAPVTTLRDPGAVQRATPLHEAALRQLRRGMSLRDAYALLRACGVTHLNNPLHAYIEPSPGAPTPMPTPRGLHALTGDHLGALLLFEDGAYVRALSLGDRAFPEVHGVRVWDSEGVQRLRFLVLSSQVGFGEPATLELVGTELPAQRYDLTALALVHEGLRQPLLLGRDLGSQDGLDLGVYLTARSGAGQPWAAAYMLHWQEQQLRIERASDAQREQAAHCSCHEDWLTGQERYPFAG